jgi:hypothetical protein
MCPCKPFVLGLLAHTPQEPYPWNVAFSKLGFEPAASYHPHLRIGKFPAEDSNRFYRVVRTLIGSQTTYKHYGRRVFSYDPSVPVGEVSHARCDNRHSSQAVVLQRLVT